MKGQTLVALEWQNIPGENKANQKHAWSSGYRRTLYTINSIGYEVTQVGRTSSLFEKKTHTQTHRTNRRERLLYVVAWVGTFRFKSTRE